MKIINQAVKRNRERFPDEFVFIVKPQEVTNLISQTVISSYTTMLSQTVTASSKRNVRRPPSAFTEHGAIMAAMVLISPQAVQMSVFVVQAFVAMLKLSPPQVTEAEEPPRPRIDFSVRERRVGYRTPSAQPPAKSRCRR
ncbi:MAG: ORF6N domain-containing protein [bacterium]